MDVAAITAGIPKRSVRAVARALTLIENEDPAAEQVLQAIHTHAGHAQILGVTGSPGSGKSTLTDRLIEAARRQGKTVAVIAVDPSSPFTGGAILGDRIRMQKRTTDAGVYIRSMGTRGNLGGLSAATADAVKVLDAAGFDLVIVETVGVGQSEVDVVRLADTVVVVLVPGAGDDVQAVKAGLMEIADVFCINKADLLGSDKVQNDLEAMMSLGHPDEDDFWWQPIVRTVAERGEGILELLEQVQKHDEWAKRTGAHEKRRAKRAMHHIRALLEDDVRRFAFERRGILKEPWMSDLTHVLDGAKTPQHVARSILDAYKQS